MNKCASTLRFFINTDVYEIKKKNHKKAHLK